LTGKKGALSMLRKGFGFATAWWHYILSMIVFTIGEVLVIPAKYLILNLEVKKFMQIKTVLRNTICSIQAVFTLAVFFILLAIEFVWMSVVITDSDPIPTTGEYAFFMMVTLVKCIFTCIFLFLPKGGSGYKALVSFGIGVVTVFWLNLLIVSFCSHVSESPNAPRLLKVSDILAIATNLFILWACIWTIGKRVKRGRGD
jgi:hypothetical protein